MNRYKARFQWWVKENEVNQDVKIFEAPNPVSALNQFHAWMQWSREVAEDRTVLRPRLGHRDYILRSLNQIYHDAHFHKNPFEQPLIESEIDLPNTPNPDLNRIMNVYDNEVEFDFVKEIDKSRDIEFEKAHREDA